MLNTHTNLGGSDVVDPGSAAASGVIAKDEFKKLQVDDLELYVIGYNHGILSHTEYEVQIGV